MTASQKIAVLEDLLVQVRRNRRKPGDALAKASASSGALGHARALDAGPLSDSAATTLRRDSAADAEERRRSTIEGPPPRAVEKGRLGTPVRPLAPAKAVARASTTEGVIVLTTRDELETSPVTAPWEPSLAQPTTTTSATATATDAVEEAAVARVEPARKQRLVALAPPMGSAASPPEAPPSSQRPPLAAAGRTVGTASKPATAPRARIGGRVESAEPDAAVRAAAIAPALSSTKASAHEAPVAKSLYDKGATLLGVGDELASTPEAIAPVALADDEHTVKISASMLADARATMEERAESPATKPVAHAPSAPPLPPPLPAAGARAAPPPPSIELIAGTDHEVPEEEEDGDPLLKTVVAGDLSVPISLSMRSEPPPPSSDLGATVQVSAVEARAHLDALTSADARAARPLSQPPPLPGSKAPPAPTDLEPAPTIELGGPPEIETAAPEALTFGLPNGDAAILPLETPASEPEAAPGFLFADVPTREAPAREATAPAPEQAAETKWAALPAPTAQASAEKPRTTRWVGLAALVAVLVGGALFVALRSGGSKAPDVPPPPPTAKPATTVAPTAAATVPAPPASAATASASASTLPSASAAVSAAPNAGPGPDGSNLPDDVGYLIVESSVPAEVYVNGHMVGLAGQPLQVPCGARFLRTGKPGQPSFFLSGGESQQIACKATTRVTINPTPFTGGAPGPSPAAAPEGGKSPAPAPAPKPKPKGDDPYN